MDSTIPLLPESLISSILPSSVAVQLGLYWTLSETPKTGFLTTRLILDVGTRGIVLPMLQNKGTDQLHDYRAAICASVFLYMQKAGFVMMWP